MSQYETYLAAVKQDGYIIKKVPLQLLSKEICIAAVKQNGTAIQFIPKKNSF